MRQFEVAIVDGADRGKASVSSDDELSIGTSEGNHLQLTDPAVSRHHCTIAAVPRGLLVTDLQSRNGTFVGDVELLSALVPSGARIRIGQTSFVVRALDRELEHKLSIDDQFGPILGASLAMRRLYPLNTALPRTATVATFIVASVVEPQRD